MRSTWCRSVASSLRLVTTRPWRLCERLAKNWREFQKLPPSDILQKMFQMKQRHDLEVENLRNQVCDKRWLTSQLQEQTQAQQTLIHETSMRQQAKENSQDFDNGSQDRLAIWQPYVSSTYQKITWDFYVKFGNSNVSHKNPKSMRRSVFAAVSFDSRHRSLEVEATVTQSPKSPNPSPLCKLLNTAQIQVTFCQNQASINYICSLHRPRPQVSHHPNGHEPSLDQPSLHPGLKSLVWTGSDGT